MSELTEIRCSCGALNLNTSQHCWQCGNDVTLTPSAHAPPEIRSGEWVDAAVARKKDWENKRIEALRVGNKERAEYWEGRRDGINEVLVLSGHAASTAEICSEGGTHE